MGGLLSVRFRGTDPKIGHSSVAWFGRERKGGFRAGLGEKRPFPNFGLSAARPFSATQPSRWEWPPLPIWKACSGQHGTTAQHRPRWSRRFDMEDREIRVALDRH